MDDVLDESDDNEDTEVDTENEEDEKDHKSQVTSLSLTQNISFLLLMISHNILCELISEIVNCLIKL